MRKPFISLILAAVLITPSWGCKKPSTTQPSSTTSSIVLISTESATIVGLTALSVKNPALASTAAASLQTTATGALAYLNGTGGAAQAISSATINSFLSAQFTGLPSEVQSFVTIAAGALDAYLPAPNAATYLSPAQLQYIKDFFTGLQSGASMFSGGSRAVAAKNHRDLGGAWFNLTSKP